MRLIGIAERALERKCVRTSQRIAECRTAIEQARRLTLHAAHRMDTVGNKVPKAASVMIKAVVTAMTCKVWTGQSRPMPAAAPARTSAWPICMPWPAPCACPTGRVSCTASSWGGWS